MEKIAILFAPEKGSTEKIARIIQKKIGAENVEMILVGESTSPDVIKPFSRLILGISTVGRDTWDSKYKKVGWDFFIPKLEKTDLSGKTVAIFGLGDHILYPDNFVDSMGSLAKQLLNSGADLIGQITTDGYTFSNSEAIVNKKFVGLPIDEENEQDLSETRIDNWLKLISGKMGISSI
jgi:flavodoxin I